MNEDEKQIRFIFNVNEYPPVTSGAAIELQNVAIKINDSASKISGFLRGEQKEKLTNENIARFVDDFSYGLVDDIKKISVAIDLVLVNQKSGKKESRTAFKVAIASAVITTMGMILSIVFFILGKK